MRLRDLDNYFNYNISTNSSVDPIKNDTVNLLFKDIK